MKKAILTGILLAGAFSIFPQSPSYNEYEMQLVHRFPEGSQRNELAREIAPSMSDMSGPTSLTAIADERWLIFDTWNERMTVYDRDFTVQEVIPAGILIGGHFVYFFRDEVFIGTTAFSWAGRSLAGERIFSLGHKTAPFPEGRYRSYWYHNGVLFIHDKDNNLVSITDPSPISEENQFSFRNTEQTRALFEPDSDWDPMGLSVDDQDRLFLDGELVTLDFKTFSDYWYEVHDGDLSKLSEADHRGGGDRYMGRDTEGNYYWQMGTRFFFVYDPNGKMIEWGHYDHNKSSTLPAVSPEGDLYFMGYEQDAINIYCIDRRW